MIYWLLIEDEFRREFVQIKHIVNVNLNNCSITIYMVNGKDIEVKHKNKQDAENYYKKLMLILGK